MVYTTHKNGDLGVVYGIVFNHTAICQLLEAWTSAPFSFLQVLSVIKRCT
jgi:hypothetical protein